MAASAKCPVVGCGTVIQVGGDPLDTTTSLILAERLKEHIAAFHPVQISQEDAARYRAMLDFSRRAFSAIVERSGEGSEVVLSQSEVATFARAGAKIDELLK